jgi:hypothetical protein
LHFAIFKRFKEEKLFDTPGGDATKMEIAGFENRGKLPTPGSEVSAAEQPKRGAAAR